jgi:hypothetical protein
VRDGFGAKRCDLVIGELIRMRDRLFDVSGDVRRNAVVVLWIVERFGIFD